MKPLLITLMFVTFTGNIELSKPFEIHTSCQDWFNRNVVTHEEKKKNLLSNHFYHTYKGKRVVGFYCSNNIPS